MTNSHGKELYPIFFKFDIKNGSHYLFSTIKPIEAMLKEIGKCQDDQTYIKLQMKRQSYIYIYIQTHLLQGIDIHFLFSLVTFFIS